MGIKMSAKDEEGSAKNRVRGFFALGDRTIYWEGWDDPKEAEYEIRRMLRIQEEKR